MHFTGLAVLTDFIILVCCTRGSCLGSSLSSPLGICLAIQYLRTLQVMRRAEGLNEASVFSITPANKD
jgi:hypothetical protein